MKARLLPVAAATLALGALGAGCGSSASPASSPAPATDGDATATHGATTTHAAPATARPVTRRVDPRRGGLEVGMGEWAVELEASTIRPGPVTFVVSNRGKTSHGFEIEADEDSSGPGGGDDRYKVESRVLAPGETVRVTLDLPVGVYKVECLVDGHDDLGMETLLEVRADAPLVTKKPAVLSPRAVSITGFAFRPAQVTVAAGETVTWTNEDTAEHTVTHDGGGFTSSTLSRGGRFRMAFDRRGTYRYFCALHPDMRGTVIVR